MAFVARRNKPFLPGNSISAVDFEDQILSTPASFAQQTIAKSFTAPYPRADASPASSDHRKNTCIHTSNMETKSAEDDYFMSALVEQMAHAMLNEESEKVDEASKAYEAASWENFSYNLYEKNLRPFQETWLQSLNFREGRFYVDESSPEKVSYPLGGKHHRLFVDNQISLANVEASSDLNARALESAWSDQRKREFAEQVFLLNDRNFPVSQLPLLIKALDYYPNLRRQSERSLIHPSFWKPVDHGCIVTNKQFLKQSSSRCNRTNKSQYQQSKANIKPCQNKAQSGHFANPAIAHCRSTQISDGGAGVRAVFLGRTGSVRESVGTGVFLPRSHAHANDSKRKPAPSPMKASASLYSKAPGSFKYNSSDKMAFSSQNKKLSPDELQPSMESRLPTEWTY